MSPSRVLVCLTLVFQTAMPILTPVIADLTWRVSLGPYEGGSEHNLSENATDDPVDAEDVCKYVQKYAELRLFKVVEGPLKVSEVYCHQSAIHNFCFFSQAMRLGITDVLPGHVLEGITAEELHMLLCGCQLVEIETLRKITTFTDESSECGGNKSIKGVMVRLVCLVMVRVVSVVEIRASRV